MKIIDTKQARNILVTILVVYGFLVAAMWAIQDRLVYPGVYAALPSWVDAARPSSVARITIPVGGRTDLAGLYRSPDSGMPTVIVFHGNAGYPEDYGFLYKSWSQRGYGIVATAYRGFPRSTGSVDAERILADSLSVYDWTRRRHPSSPIVVFGQSLGTSPAIHVAANRDVSAVVLVSPFESLLAIATARFPFLPVAAALRSPFRSDLDMPAVTAPVAIFHGDLDEVVPISSAKALASRAPSQPLFLTVEGAGHVEGLFGGNMVRAINSFIAGKAIAGVAN